MGGGARPGRALLLVENLSVPFDRRVWREAVSLRDAGWQVTVISPRGLDRDTARRETIDGIEVRRFKLIEAEGAFTAYVVEYGFAVLSMFWLALRVWLRKGFDVIQICNPPDLLIFAALPFKLVGARVIFDHHDLSPELYISKNPDNPPGRVHRALLFFERLTFRLANVVMSTNETYRRIALERGGKRPEDVFVVRNGPELSRLKNAAPNPGLKKGAEHLIVYVGMMGTAAALVVVIALASISFRTGVTTSYLSLPLAALIDAESVYEASNAAEYEAAIEGAFAEAVSSGEAVEMLDLLDDIPVEDQLYDLDKGSLDTLDKMLRHANENKSG